LSPSLCTRSTFAFLCAYWPCCPGLNPALSFTLCLYPDPQAFGSFAPEAAFWLNNSTGLSAGLDWKFSKKEFKRCLDATTYASWMEWTYCIDMSSYFIYFPNSPAWDKYSKHMSTMFHAGECC
jgi:hypothetical protein